MHMRIEEPREEDAALRDSRSLSVSSTFDGRPSGRGRLDHGNAAVAHRDIEKTIEELLAVEDPDGFERRRPGYG
jgi:hypothetical protein